MLQTLRKAWGVPDIRRKILVVLVILAIYRIGSVIPVPFVSADVASGFASAFGDTIFSYMSVLSGGALEQATLFALGVSAYITASIVLQLLTVAFPKLGERAKQGEEGKAFINKWTRIVTIALAIVTAIGYYVLLARNSGMLVEGASFEDEGSPWFLYATTIVVCFCAGAALVMWLAEKINENGLGNGISLILFFNIICSLPNVVKSLVPVIRIGFNTGVGAAFASVGLTLFILLGLLAMTFFIIFITGSERRIPVQYAKRVVGRKMYGGQSTNLPLQLNMSGVMPVIFASSIVSLPSTILVLCQVSDTTKGFWGFLYRLFDPNGWVYPILLFVLIIAFAYFYITISFNPMEVANNLKKNGGMIPGIRQGRPTAEYIAKILSKITLMGALFLSIVAILPIIVRPLVLEPLLGVSGVSSGDTLNALASTFTFGGTSILIVVGIALETYREIEAQLTMRNYKGFL
ncbi:MAG: preprotein translocase subunit SecY [Clostridia bacterium]|nr:preprotein translocase subunit SecY [Clostridia bacterium]